MFPAVLSYAGSGGVDASAALVFFADEAGNTGANHLDAEQPYYVTGGWLLREADQERARNCVRRALRETQMSELSGPKLLKTTLGRNAALQLAGSLLAFATPLLVIIEKSFKIGSRLVSEFLTPLANPRATDHFDMNSGAARSTAALLSTLPRPVLEAANRYLRSPGEKEARGCIEALVPALKHAGQDELAFIFAGVLEVLPRGWEQVDPIRQKGLSPNVTGFTTLLQRLEILGRRSDQKIGLFHDEMKQLADVYRFYQQLGAANRFSKRAIEFFERAGCPGGITKVSAPEFRDSFHEPLIQAADLWTGLAAALLRKEAKGQAWAEHERELAVLVLGGFFNTDLRDYLHFVGLHETGMRVGQLVVDTLGAIAPSD